MKTEQIQIFENAAANEAIEREAEQAGYSSSISYMKDRLHDLEKEQELDRLLEEGFNSPACEGTLEELSEARKQRVKARLGL